MEKTNKTKLWDKIKSGKKMGKDQFIIFILAGILLIIVALPTSNSTEKKTIKSGLWDGGDDKIEITKDGAESSGLGGVNSDDEIESYERYLENKLEQAITVMEGAGKVKVVVTVGASKETVVEKDVPEAGTETLETDAEGGNRTIKDTESQEETVYIKKSDGSQSPYVIKTLQPVIEGVVVVAQGGGHAEVRKNITEAIVALFDIEPHKIKVVKMKSE